MKRISVKTSKDFLQYYELYYSLLGFKLKNKEEKMFSKYLLEFEIENKDKYFENYSKLKPLKPNIPFFPIILFALLAVTLLTLFLVNFFVGFTTISFYIFMLPALISMLIATVISCTKIMFVMHNVKVFDELNELQYYLDKKENGKN